MNFLITLQTWILELSPALLPALSIIYSFLSSFHCSVMCSPLIPRQNPDKYYLGRLISYSFIGGLLGAFGSLLLKSLEFKLFSILAFFIFAITTLITFGYISLNTFFSKKTFAVQKQSKSNLYRGLLSALIPCHLLYFFYSLAVLSGTSIGGSIILFSHAVISMPALVYGNKAINYTSQKLSISKKITRLIILAVCILNLVYFGSRIFNTESEAKNKVLFCI